MRVKGESASNPSQLNGDGQPRVVRAGALAGGRGKATELCEALATNFEFSDGAWFDKANTTSYGATFSGACVRPRKESPKCAAKGEERGDQFSRCFQYPP
jgi:hypothetical protein